MLKQICEFSGILDSYQAYEDGDLNKQDLIELCQEKVDQVYDENMCKPALKRNEYVKYRWWLGI